MTINLSLQSSFEYSSPDAMAFDPASGNIFLARATIVTPQQFIIDWKIDQLNPNGQFVSSFTSSELPLVLGLSLLPNGNIILLSPTTNRIIEFTKSGQIVPGGVNLTFNQSQLPQGAFVTDIIFRPQTGTIFGVDGFAPRIYEFDTTGNVVSTINLSASLPNAAFQGVTIDPLTGNLLVADDAGGQPRPGDNTIYEVTPAGQVISTIDVEAITGFADPEGLAIDPATRTLYVAFDTDDARGTDIYVPNRNRVVTFKLEMDTFSGDTSSNDTRIGDGTANNFLGGGGNDNYSGLQGADIIYGGLDNDTLNGNQDNDQVFGGAGNDVARGGSGNDYVGGSTGDDTLYGDQGNDTVTGGVGNDIINGNAGNDSLTGGEGNDIMRGGRDNDVLTGNQGNDSLYGDLGNDSLFGGEGNDSLLGESGEDILNGGAGADTLTGGASRDTFVLAIGTGPDVITDFVAGTDLIGLTSGLTYDQLTFTQEVTNNITTGQLRVNATGEILASLTGVSTTSITRNMLVSI